MISWVSQGERKEHMGRTMQQLYAIVCLFLSSSSARYKHCHSKTNDINRRCLYPWSTSLLCFPIFPTSVHIFSPLLPLPFPASISRLQSVAGSNLCSSWVVTDPFLQAVSVNVPPLCQRPVTHVKVKLWTVILCLPKLIQTKHTMYK